MVEQVIPLLLTDSGFCNTAQQITVNLGIVGKTDVVGKRG
jgi:hypothetical protein